MTAAGVSYPDSVWVEHVSDGSAFCSRCGAVLAQQDLAPQRRVHNKAGTWAPAGSAVVGAILPCFPQRPPGVT